MELPVKMDLEYVNEAEFYFDTFSVFYDRDTHVWRAQAYDEEMYPDEIILEDDETTYDDTELFDSPFSSEDFLILKRMVDHAREV